MEGVFLFFLKVINKIMISIMVSILMSIPLLFSFEPYPKVVLPCVPNSILYYISFWGAFL